MRVEPKKNKIEKHHLEDFVGRAYMSFCVLLLIVIIVSMVYFVASKGISTFTSGDVKITEFLFGTKWSPEGDAPSYGAFPFIAGSFLVTLIAALIASPLSICAALFMTEIVPGWGKKLLQPVIELLSGIPSVVYGFVGLSVIVPFLRNTFPGQGIGVAAGALVLSVMILPTITSVAADALASLPQNLKESSFALGATRWQTIARVILPTTFPAIMTGVVLGMARAFGEALAVQMVIGNAPFVPKSLFESASTLTSVITLSMGNTTMGSPQNNALWSMALVLMLMTFVFVLLVRMLERRNKI
ncbi:phosphate ABC transporter permease subunit PstC [Paenibacillus sonchi]|uniref:Phosphate transport system permease protein n=2 Tax=Paenibacillus sonchi group TaxID=2044880 RepID=A0A974PAM9_9BACL|nr:MULTISPECIES: phosphate ABC transporter permease subunit PstC [Paenibacillus sonchi group]KWX80717.1 phosphate ABC transporter permease [Paenibacillus riograndensis]MCE3201209.1 phosphate ABC transporter permease subunit PstC [Paenibacillus sonchi]QQZ59918.1 phosphate ABC transporter permease subunit PstC [Paenibacillus sonchi]CQR56107.1 putative ABC transporter permease protein YqgH [Paenibacillus riograndensis SBR5]